MSISNWIPAVGVMAALLGLIYQIRKSTREERIRRSEFSLREVVAAYEQALELLSNGNNKRDIWIASARIIERAERVAKDISEPTHADLLEIRKDQYRRLIGDALGYDKTDVGGGFFYGVSLQSYDIDEAARVSTARSDGSVRSSQRQISESSIYTLWTFARYPDDYEDPLANHRFDDERINSGTFRAMWPGLAAYLTHIRRYISIGGVLHPRPNPSDND